MGSSPEPGDLGTSDEDQAPRLDEATLGSGWGLAQAGCSSGS